MSDLRNFTPIRDDSMRLDERLSANDVVFVDDGGLGNFHISNDADEKDTRRSKLYAGVAVALVFGLAGAWGVSQLIKDQPVVSDESLPSPSAPSRTAAMTPPVPAAPAMEAAAPTAPDVVLSAPVSKEAAMANAPKVTAAPKSSSAMNSAPVLPPPEQQYTAPAVTAPAQAASAPEPASPVPPVSTQAGNPALNQQSAPSEEAATPQAAPATPDATPAPSLPEQAPAQ